MIVEHILQTKGSSVITIVEDKLIADAVRVLNENNIGALVVLDASGRISGILSERDIVRRLKEDGNSLMRIAVSECMTPKPFTCQPSATIDEVMSLMTKRRIRHLPVVNGSTLAGVISIGDVVKRKIEEIEEEAAAMREYIAS